MLHTSRGQEVTSTSNMGQGPEVEVTSMSNVDQSPEVSLLVSTNDILAIEVSWRPHRCYIYLTPPQPSDFESPYGPDDFAWFFGDDTDASDASKDVLLNISEEVEQRVAVSQTPRVVCGDLLQIVPQTNLTSLDHSPS